MIVHWAQVGRSRVAHAFAEIDLSVGFERVEPLAGCGRFPVADLQPDDTTSRCSACQHALIGSTP
jgi:hypothetical protein